MTKRRRNTEQYTFAGPRSQRESVGRETQMVRQPDQHVGRRLQQDAIQLDFRRLCGEQSCFGLRRCARGHVHGQSIVNVDSQSADDMAKNRGSFAEPGKNSPYRDRPVAESLDLLRRMKAGEFKDGEHILRAKIV